MPQLDFQWFSAQLYWLALTFITLYIVLAKVSLPRLERVVRDRKEHVSTDLRKAETYKQQAENLEREYTKALDAAHKNADKLISEANSKAAERNAKGIANLEKAISKKLLDAEKNISDMRTQAIKNIIPHQVEICQMVLKKLVNVSIQDDKVTSAVNNLMKGIK